MITHYPATIKRDCKRKPFLGVEIFSTLQKPAKINSKEWKESADQWCVILKSEKGETALDYWTGIGHRTKPKGNPLSIAAIEDSQAIPPECADVLYSLLSDSQIYIEARDSLEPSDEIAANLGYEKPSEAREVFEGCKRSFVMLRELGLNIDALAAALEAEGY